MKDSEENKHRLFTIAIYDFNEEDIGTLGYFSSEPYNSQSSRNAYAAFYMNLSSIRNNYNESGAKAAAESFLKTFAHEYTHYAGAAGAVAGSVSVQPGAPGGDAGAEPHGSERRGL